MNLIAPSQPTTGLPGLASTSAPATTTNANTGPTFGALLDGQMAPAEAPDRPTASSGTVSTEARADIPAELANNQTGRTNTAGTPENLPLSPVEAAATTATTAVAEFFDMLDLVQQVRSAGNFGVRSATTDPVLKSTAPAGPAAATAAAATTATAAAAAATTATATAAAATTASPPAPTQAAQPALNETGRLPLDRQVTTIAATQVPTITMAEAQATSTKAPPRDDEAATDAQAPTTATTPMPDAVTMALLAGGQIQAVTPQPSAPASDTPAKAIAPDTGSPTAATQMAGHGRTDRTPTPRLAVEPSQEEPARATQETTSLMEAVPTTLLKQGRTDADLENNTVASTGFEARLAAQAERTAGTEQLQSNPSASSASVSASQAPVVTSAHVAAPVQHQILTGFGHSGWDQAVSQRVLWLAQDQLQQASLTLNPPHLGPVQVTVQIDNQQAMVQFVSNQPEVRQALQDALPVLREMFGQAGIALGQADVSSHNSGQRQTRQSTGTEPGANDEPDLALDGFATVLPRTAGQGLINLFA